MTTFGTGLTHGIQLGATFQEASMFKKAANRLKALGHMRISLAHIIAGLVATASLVLIYSLALPGEQADARCPGSQNNFGTGVNEATKLLILQWMKERSEMSEQVLSKIYNVAMNKADSDLVLAICLVESNFNPHAESNKGAMGLMGIMPNVWLKDLKTQGIVREQDDLYSISNNINSGIYVLERYLTRTNSLREALSRYAGGDPAYARRVLRAFGEISRVRRFQGQPRLMALRSET